ncbi:hypothetical protein MVEG_02628 [Podila verticillata NRRL 6337]|nr:hypothetical protein MVEG_02628 [Podila verticillata NRRL 6337]
MDQSAANDDREDAEKRQLPTVATENDRNGASEASGNDLTSKKQQGQEFEQQRVEALKATREALYQRCREKLQALDELKVRLAEKGTPAQSANPSSRSKQLDILRTEEQRLRYHVQRLKASKHTVFDELPEVTRLRVNQSVQDSIHGYEIGTPLLKAELEETKQELAAENQTLKESLEIKEALNARLSDLAKAIEKGTSQESSQGRQKLLEARLQVQELMRELTGFLNAHYPPIQPDDDDPAAFQLKNILEDIMNLSVSSPGDPYLVLERGSYYPPHIEQLINAGIAVRHPRDAQRLRLVDFYS